MDPPAPARECQGADYVTGSGSNGSVNGGNGGTVMFCYVSNSSAQLGELMKALTAKSPSFRARAQKLGVMVLKDTADIASAQATAVTTQTAGFETNCQTLAGLIPTFDLIKSRFGPIMPKATQTALKATVEAPRYDQSTYTNAMATLSSAADKIVKTSVTEIDIAWDDLLTAVGAFKRALAQINPKIAQFQTPSDPSLLETALGNLTEQINLKTTALQNDLAVAYQSSGGNPGGVGAGATAGSPGNSGTLAFSQRHGPLLGLAQPRDPLRLR
ncbi:hypothetical protein B0J13DRAFT_629676 [Dactylonectria estremocensis]|uniref:Uncharacterized protein n=1 Tax=Dactylonectria estremocensis TaxID=1079267 RepID=A0A9P9DG39_9HYPO|nr:hypothetical protein B0J13DRAFT_629676 [Dactylonectria estremocensis]